VPNHVKQFITSTERRRGHRHRRPPAPWRRSGMSASDRADQRSARLPQPRGLEISSSVRAFEAATPRRSRIPDNRACPQRTPRLAPRAKATRSCLRAVWRAWRDASRAASARRAAFDRRHHAMTARVLQRHNHQVWLTDRCDPAGGASTSGTPALSATPAGRLKEGQANSVQRNG
jgi:hypothetical protein